MTREELLEAARKFYMIHKDCLINDTPIKEYLEIGLKALEQKLCDDVISRQAVIKTLDDMDNVLDEERTIENYKELLKECYKVLPPVKPQEPKIGHWIEHPHEAGPCWEYSRYECSECHEWAEDDSDYCPDCGCHMIEPQADKEQEDWCGKYSSDEKAYKDFCKDYLKHGAESLIKDQPDLVRDIWNCSSCEHTEDECKDCYPELGYKNNKRKRDTEAVNNFTKSDIFKEIIESFDKEEAGTEPIGLTREMLGIETRVTKGQ